MADRSLPGRPTRKADIRALAAEDWDWSRLKSPPNFKVVARQVMQNVLKSAKAASRGAITDVPVSGRKQHALLTTCGLEPAI
ncbi:hypothetical protein BKP54_31465 [Ensifer sp. 1H6]|nr:hypothetical protein [Ensifer adhaerens]OMQ38843.1 hypothetical protein BKP54_31465 [Ensifer sp. 1H6]